MIYFALYLFVSKKDILGISNLSSQISKVNSIWTVAAFTMCAIIVVLRIAGKIREGQKIIIFYVALPLIFLMGLAPIVANSFKHDDIKPYTFTIDVLNPSGLHPETSDVNITSNPTASEETVSGNWRFTILKSEIDDSSITFSAQTKDKLSSGAITIRFNSKRSSYSGTIKLNSIKGGTPTIIAKTFSLSFNNPQLKEAIEHGGLVFKENSPNYRITLSFDRNKIISNAGAGTFMLEECYPEILINGSICTTINEYPIAGTAWLNRKELIISYVNERLSALPKRYLLERSNRILSCIKN